MPQRIQPHRSRPSDGWSWWTPAGAVWVGQTSKWDNPFKVGGPRTPDATAAFARFSTMLLMRGANWTLATLPPYPANDEIRGELAGKDLACWCPPEQPCHADALLEIANREGEP
jgi:hypothetical protein